MRPLSQRSEPSGRPNQLSLALERARRAGNTWLDLTSSNPSQVGLAWPDRELRQAYDVNANDYAPHPFGEPAARATVCHALQRAGLPHVEDPSRTLLTASTSEAYALLFKLLCDPGQAVLAPSPSYPLFEALARLEGVTLVPYPLRYDGRWHIDTPALREAATRSAARAIVLVSPNNPTGSCVQRDELAAIAELGLPIVSDEVFADYPLAPETEAAPSALHAAHEALVFRMSGLSKHALLPQAKLAWTSIAGPSDLADEACERLELLADTYLSPATLVQRALPQLLAGAASIRERALQRLRRNLRALREACEGSVLTALHVEAGWYAIVRLPAVLTEEQWALRLLQEGGLLVQPGYFYDIPGGPHVVLSLLSDPDGFERGLAQLLEACARHCA